MNHVESSRNRGHTDAALARRAADPFCHDGIDFLRQALQSGASKVELNAIEFVHNNGVEGLVKRRADKRLRKNAELHQTLPFTLSRQMRSPVSTERAIATSARMAARPSSTFAPCCGLPCRMVSANPSSWRL